MNERIDTLEARMGRSEETVKSFVAEFLAEFRQLLRTKVARHLGVASTEEDLGDNSHLFFRVTSREAGKINCQVFVERNRRITSLKVDMRRHFIGK